MSRALVLGGNGMLARELKPALAAGGFDVVSADLPECDITNGVSVAAIFQSARPDWVFNCAAWTKVDLSEKEVDATFKVNAEGAGIVARATKPGGARLVHLSTDYVFDGLKNAPYNEDDACAPMGVYARSKRAGEEQVLGSGGRAYVVRTGELYGDGGPNFFDAIFKRARSGQGLRVVSDQVVAPTWTRELARQLVALVEKAPAPGVYHATCAGAVTWHDAAVHALKVAKLEVPVTPVSTQEYGSPTPRPLYSVLGHGALVRLGLYNMRAWDVALEEWIRLRSDPS